MVLKNNILPAIDSSSTSNWLNSNQTNKAIAEKIYIRINRTKSDCCHLKTTCLQMFTVDHSNEKKKFKCYFINI